MTSIEGGIIITTENSNENKDLYSIDEDYYYVYEHWLGDELIYIGKGKGNRAFVNVRNEIWNSKVKNSKHKIKVVIKGHFKDQKDAFLFEEILIKEAIRDGVELTNITHNLKDTLDKHILNMNKLEETIEEEMKILSENTRNAVGFHHHEELHEIIENTLNKDGNKVVIFSSDRSKRLLKDLSKKIRD